MFSLPFVLCYATIALAVPLGHVVHERNNHVPSRWVKQSRVDARTWFPVRIGLSQENLNTSHELLMDVSHPDSPNYGKFWSQQQVIEAFQPSEETINNVLQWLIEGGIDHKTITHSDNRGWLAFHATANQTERLLNAQYYVYEDKITGHRMPACEAYYVPERIHKHIDYITPGIRLLAPESRNGQKRAAYDNLEPRLKRSSRHRRPVKLTEPQGRMTNNASDLSTCDVAITPACIRALYRIPEPGPRHPSPNNSMGIFETELQAYYQPDLDLFFRNLSSWIPQGTHPTIVDIDGGFAVTANVSEGGQEADLDLQLAYPIVYPQTITVFNVDDVPVQSDPNDTYTSGYNTFLDALDGSYCNYSAYGEQGDDPVLDPQYPDLRPGGFNGTLQCGVYKPTNIISLSYIGQEADVPVAYQKRQCNEFLKLGLQGVSIFFASGDAGVATYPEPYGFDGPTGCLGPNLNIFNPGWPASCPYITSVGATKVYPGKTVFDSESAVFDPAGHPFAVNFSSGGGFSNIYPVPAYQQQAVATFFENHNPKYPYYSALANQTGEIHDITTHPNVTALAGDTGGIYNRIGRGYPDVSANGDNTAVYVSEVFQLGGGTSASAPIFAAIMNRIVEERLAVGKGPVGFVNPALYANPSMFNDITNGSNPGCGTNGFEAVEGWDPVTGLGTPDFVRMREYFLALP